mmetsp:Transcript_18707/g.46481  ORF Transcript_18707/g.46481 Transcript_18707/m.46481 type:complete len:175 (+) Transcript_18707:1189-1713(+)
MFQFQFTVAVKVKHLLKVSSIMAEAASCKTPDASKSLGSMAVSPPTAARWDASRSSSSPGVTRSTSTDERTPWPGGKNSSSAPAAAAAACEVVGGALFGGVGVVGAIGEHYAGTRRRLREEPCVRAEHARAEPRKKRGAAGKWQTRMPGKRGAALFSGGSSVCARGCKADVPFL